METLDHTSKHNTESAPSSPSIEKFNNWFDGFLSNISVDRMLIATDTATAETKQFYTDFVNDDYGAVSTLARETSTRYFISKIITEYFDHLKAFKTLPQKLAFDFSDAKILVWAQIADDDEKAEDALILSEAETNSKFSDNGFYVASTIVEESDNLAIPEHYHQVTFDGRVSGAR